MKSFRFMLREAYIIGGVIWAFVACIYMLMIIMQMLNSDYNVLKPVLFIIFSVAFSVYLIRRFVLDAFTLTEDELLITNIHFF